MPRETPPAIPPLATAAMSIDDHELVSANEERESANEGENARFSSALDEPACFGSASSSPRLNTTQSQPLSPADHDAATGERAVGEVLAEAVVRVAVARAELAVAETALDAAVSAAHEDGLSWRSIGRVTGVGHRDAATRWGPPGGGPSL